MGVKIEVRDGEPLPDALRRLRRLLLDESGNPLNIARWSAKRRLDCYERPSILRRRRRWLETRSARRPSPGRRDRSRRRPVPAALDAAFESLRGVLERCRFVLRRFMPYPSLVDYYAASGLPEGWVTSRPCRGKLIHRGRFVLKPEGWDHEHCNLCWAAIYEGESYWDNRGDDHVQLCEDCFGRFESRLRRLRRPGVAMSGGGGGEW